MCSGTKDIAPIWKEIFPSPEMASYLAKCKLTKLKIRDAVAYAAIPLERKRDIFLQLASGKKYHLFPPSGSQYRGGYPGDAAQARGILCPETFLL